MLVFKNLSLLKSQSIEGTVYIHIFICQNPTSKQHELYLCFIFSSLLASLRIPYSQELLRVGGHSKRLLTQFKVTLLYRKAPSLVQWSACSPST